MKNKIYKIYVAHDSTETSCTGMSVDVTARLDETQMASIFAESPEEYFMLSRQLEKAVEDVTGVSVDSLANVRLIDKWESFCRNFKTVTVTWNNNSAIVPKFLVDVKWSGVSAEYMITRWLDMAGDGYTSMTRVLHEFYTILDDANSKALIDYAVESN